MNKKILVIGIVMLIIGIAMAAGGTEYFESSFTDSSSTHYSEIKSTCLNVSSNITVKSGYIVIIDGTVSDSLAFCSTDFRAVALVTEERLE